jgi:hypothetical protein
MCSVCIRPVRDVLYCEDCLATNLGLLTPAAAPGAAETQTSLTNPAVAPSRGLRPSPLLAFLLGFMPGLGAFYNEQYGKGVIHLAIFLFLFILGVDGGMSEGSQAALWICVAALWIYMPIDAYRTAKARLAGQELHDPLEDLGKGRPVGPLLIIGIGVLLLLHNFDWFPFYRIQQFWPVLLIIVGILMFKNRLGGRS